VCARFRRSGSDLGSPSQAAKFALRSVSRRIEALDREIAELDRELEQLVAIAAPRTIELLGISTGHAGQLLVTAGQNIERVRSEGSFSMLCGASPIPAPQARPHATASTPAATAKPTKRLTSSPWLVCATAHAPAHRTPTPDRNRNSSPLSTAAAPAPGSPADALDIYRNV